MYDHLHVLEWQLRQQPDPIARLLARDALVDLERPSALDRGLARAVALVAGLTARRDGAAPRPLPRGHVGMPAARGAVSAEPPRPARAA